MDINYNGLIAEGNSIEDLFSDDTGISLQELDKELLKTISGEENDFLIRDNYGLQEENISTEYDESEEMTEEESEDVDDIDSSSGDTDIDTKVKDDDSHLSECDDINFTFGIKGKSGDSIGEQSTENISNSESSLLKKFAMGNAGKGASVLNKNPMSQVFPNIKDVDFQEEIKKSQEKKIFNTTQSDTDGQRKKEHKKSKKKKTTVPDNKKSETNDKTIKTCSDLLSKEGSDLYELCSEPEVIFQKEENPTYDINENGLIEDSSQINTNKHSASIDYINNFNRLKKPPTIYKSDNISNPIIFTKSQNEESNIIKNTSVNTDKLNVEGTLRLKRRRKQQNYLFIVLITLSIMISLIFLFLVFQ